jgi:pantothenate kinase type III
LLEAFFPPSILKLFFGPDVFVESGSDASVSTTDISQRDRDGLKRDIGDGEDNDDGDAGEGKRGHRHHRHSRLTLRRILRAALRHRRNPIVYVYLISTNPATERLVAFLLQDCPVVVIWRLRNADFFSTEDGCYPTLGPDRAAAALAAASLGGVPSLVLDGGTATTYTCVDANGRLEGGGIVPGIGLKLRSLAGGTGALPSLRPDQVAQRIQECEATRRPLPFLSSNTGDAILSGVLRETTAHAASIIELWRERALRQLNSPEIDTSSSPSLSPSSAAASRQSPATANYRRLPRNAARRFFVTGGDGPLLLKLLAPDHSHILELLPDFPKHGCARYAVLSSAALSTAPSAQGSHGAPVGDEQDYPLQQQQHHHQQPKYQHLVHHGIAEVLRERQAALRGTVGNAAPSDGDESLQSLAQLEVSRGTLVGLRVARKTAAAADAAAGSGSWAEGSNGSGMWLRGTVASVACRGLTLDQDLYTILYDDRAMEIVTVIELHGTEPKMLCSDLSCVRFSF